MLLDDRSTRCVCEQLTQRCYAAVPSDQESNPQLSPMPNLLKHYGILRQSLGQLTKLRFT